MNQLLGQEKAFYSVLIFLPKLPLIAVFSYLLDEAMLNITFVVQYPRKGNDKQIREFL